MEGLLALLLGAFAVAAAPLVPALRPAVKAAVKGGMVLTGAAAGAAVAAGQQLDHLKDTIHKDGKSDAEPIPTVSSAATPPSAPAAAHAEVTQVVSSPIGTETAEVWVADVATTQVADANPAEVGEPTVVAKASKKKTKAKTSEVEPPATVDVQATTAALAEADVASASQATAKPKKSTSKKSGKTNKVVDTPSDL
jgi:hypothetical protein